MDERLIIDPIVLSEDLLRRFGATMQSQTVAEPPAETDLLSCRLWAYFNGPYQVQIKDGRPEVSALI